MEWAWEDRGTAGRGYTPRRDEKSAEAIDTQRVEGRPLRKRVRNPLKRKDLNEKKAEMEVTQGEKIEDGNRQTRERIAKSSPYVNVFIGHHSNGAVRR